MAIECFPCLEGKNNYKRGDMRDFGCNGGFWDLIMILNTMRDGVFILSGDMYINNIIYKRYQQSLAVQVECSEL